LDNGCFSEFREKTWRRMVKEAEYNRPLWVAMPDIVGDARRTVELFHQFAHVGDVPRALVLQDGIGNVEIPWDKIDAVFVGGSDAFKIAPDAIHACKAAKMLGKWVHVGRVNTAARVRNWIGLADSIDGSGLCKYDHMLIDVLRMIKGDHPKAYGLFDDVPTHAAA
jgi:hypothetical protein